MLLFQYAAQVDQGRMAAIELTAHYQYNLSSSSKTTEPTFRVCLLTLLQRNKKIKQEYGDSQIASQ